MYKMFLILLLVTIFYNANTYRIGVISDVHINPYYRADTSENNCWGNDGPWEIQDEQYDHIDVGIQSTNAPDGRLGCDPPFQTVKLILENMKEREPKLDFILFLGDSVGHSISLKPDKGTGDWNLVKKQIQDLTNEIQQLYPDIYILQIAGNDDLKYHGQCPNEDNKQEYYGFLYDTYFLSVPKNLQYPKLNEVKSTIMNGGYYRFDIDEKLTLLCLNTLYYSSDNDMSKQGTIPEDQIAWLQDQLNASNDRKFIIIMHYYPGHRYKNKAQVVMEKQYITQFHDIFMQNFQKIIIYLAGHDHLGDLRYHSDDFNYQIQEQYQRRISEKLFYYNFIENPAISPNKGNNPGYSILEIDSLSFKPQNMIQHFFQLQNTYDSGYSNDGSQKFYTINFNDDLGIMDLTPEGMKDFKNRLVKDDIFTYQYLANKYGFFQEDESICIKRIYQDYLKLITDPKMKTYKFICLMHKSIYKEELENCISSNS